MQGFALARHYLWPCQAPPEYLGQVALQALQLSLNYLRRPSYGSLHGLRHHRPGGAVDALPAAQALLDGDQVASLLRSSLRTVTRVLPSLLQGRFSAVVKEERFGWEFTAVCAPAASPQAAPASLAIGRVRDSSTLPAAPPQDASEAPPTLKCACMLPTKTGGNSG